jgi:hypothetical protein
MVRIAVFDPISSANGALYRPRAFADQNGGRWDGYIVFFPIGSGTVVSTPRETTQVDFSSLQAWALALDDIYLDGALVRALEASGGVEFPATAPDVAAAEINAATDAITLHRAAERAAAEASAELAAAEMHDDAATVARANASRLTRRQDDLESLANETTRATAEAAAEAHESAARQARAVAADAAPGQSAAGKPRRKRSTPRKNR